LDPIAKIDAPRSPTNKDVEEKMDRKPFVFCVTVVAIVVGHLIFLTHGYHLIHDARGYYLLSKALSQTGMFGLSDEKLLPEGVGILLQIRTYGYPLFISACSLFTSGRPGAVQFTVFEAQLMLHLAACYCGARSLQRAGVARGFSGTLYACTVLNPWLLIRTTELLTDSVSASLVYLVFAMLLDACRGRPASNNAVGERVSRMLPWRLAGVFFLGGFAVMVRPSNIAVIPAMFLIWLMNRSVGVKVRLAALPALVTALSIPFIPQIVNNYNINQKINPLIIFDLRKNSTSFGTAYLKQVAIHNADSNLILLHNNPFSPDSSVHPSDFCRRRPGAYFMSCALHVFTLFEQDNPLTFPAKARSWYRWPSTVLSFVFVGLSGWGIATFVRRFRRRGLAQKQTFGAASAVLMLACVTAPYVASHSEARYTMPIYFLLSLFLASALSRLRRLIQHRAYVRLVSVTAAVGSFVTACCLLSNLLDSYSWILKVG
jgi:hypothetical protein